MSRSEVDLVGDPPPFPGSSVGQTGNLAASSSAVRVARGITAPRKTLQLLRQEAPFDTLWPAELATAADTLTFVFDRMQRWRLVWVETVPGPGRFVTRRSVQVGAGEEAMRTASRTAGLEVKGSAPVLSGAASHEWSRATQSSVTLARQTELERSIELDIPEEGMDIALWQLEDVLRRQIALRPGAELPPDPLPRWVEMAVSSRPIEMHLGSHVTRVTKRSGWRAPTERPRSE